MIINGYLKNYEAMADPAIVKDVCLNIKQMRLNMNMSQTELAEKSGLDRTTISRVESGRAATLLTLVQILRGLRKLELLSAFNQEPEISPMMVLEQQEKFRKKATPRKYKK